MDKAKDKPAKEKKRPKQKKEKPVSTYRASLK